MRAAPRDRCPPGAGQTSYRRLVFAAAVEVIPAEALEWNKLAAPERLDTIARWARSDKSLFAEVFAEKVRGRD